MVFIGKGNSGISACKVKERFEVDLSYSVSGR